MAVLVRLRRLYRLLTLFGRFYGVFEDPQRSQDGELAVNIVTELLEGTVFRLDDEVFQQ